MTLTVPAAFEAVEFSYWALSPMIVLLVGGFVGVLVEAFAPRPARHVTQVVVSVSTLVLSFAALVFMTGDETGVSVGGTVAVDEPTRFMQGALLLLGLLGLFVMADRLGGETADAFTPMGAASPGSNPRRRPPARAGRRPRSSRSRSSRSPACCSSPRPTTC